MSEYSHVKMSIINRFSKHRLKGLKCRVIILLVVLLCIVYILLQLFPVQPDDYVHVAPLTRRNTSDRQQTLRSKDGWSYAKIFSYNVVDPHANLVADSFSSRIENLKRIKVSLSNELRLMERDKQRLIKEKNNLIGRNDKLLSQINKSKMQLKQLELDINANRRQKFEKNCDSEWVAPVVFNPMKSADLDNFSMSYTSSTKGKQSWESSSAQDSPLGEDSFSSLDYSLCPLTKPFKFTFEGVANSVNPNDINSDKTKLDPSIVQDILQAHSSYVVAEQPQSVCLLIKLVQSGLEDIPKINHPNHLIISLSTGDLAPVTRDNDRRQFLWADSSFQVSEFRPDLDIVVPSIWQHPEAYNTIVGSIPSQSPISRKYFASYFGQTVPGNSSSLNARDQDFTNKLEQILLTIHQNSIDDLFLFIYECSQAFNEQCYESRERMIEMSTFLIIIPKQTRVMDENTNDLIYMALSRGAIPVIVGSERIRLPFDEVIDWRLASVLLPAPRLPELHFILRSYSASDIYRMKYHGRRIFEHHLATAKQILATLVNLVSIQKFNYPPKAIEDYKTVTYFDEKQLIYDTNCSTNACQETQSTDSTGSLIAGEILGPREKPFKSKTFARNFSLVLNSNYELWNNPMLSASHLFPSLPQDPVPPSEYKFLVANSNYRPINEGLGGSGADFSRSLGGDYPNEQFTIVLLTYERRSLLMKTLERLKNLAYLNKIVVVWNGIHEPPPRDLLWPDVGVPIVVAKVELNSLNNRFLPFDVIETDAIFSMDDDSPLRPDEIVFAFRVWRQSRDRIVGFPGRFHAWDPSKSTWLYDSNHSCELSMVLTGGAFFHKYYAYAYSYFMPNSIRSIVDKFMNCEDIAMNFLVAHLTRKPPIKVTSRWTFHCPNCASSLSEDDSHFRERHECLNIFASIYGYMPLLNTQHRSDSILFKTRLPGDKQKCFKFV